MSRIILKSVIAEGFGSILEPVSFTLNRGGIWFIKGSNGAGKTTLFSALSWALYKVNLKGTNNDKVPSWLRLRPKSFRGTRVVVEFEKDGIDFMIARHIKFKGTTRGIEGGNSLMIFEKPSADSRPFTEKDLIGEAHYKYDQQEYINKVIGLDSQAFLASVLFGQRMKRLIEADNTEKRKLFEMLFDLDFIANARSTANKQFGELEKIIVAKETEEKYKNAAIHSLEEQLKSEEKVKQDLEDKKRNKCTEVENLIADQEEKISLTKAAIVTKTELAKKYNTEGILAVSNEITQLKQKKQEILEKISNLKISFQEEVSNKYEAEEIKLRDEIQKLKDAKTASLSDLEKEAEEINSKLKIKEVQLEKEEDALRNLTSTVNGYKNEIKEIEKKITKLQDNVDKIETKCPICTQDLPEAKIKEAKTNIQSEISKEKKALEALNAEKKAVEPSITIQTDSIDVTKKVIQNYKNSLQEKRDKYKEVKAEDDGCLNLQQELEKLLETKKADLNLETNQDYIRLNTKLSNVEEELSEKETNKTTIETANAKFKEAVDELPILNNNLEHQNTRLAELQQELVLEKNRPIVGVDTKLTETKLEEAKEELEAIEKALVKHKEKLEKIRWWLGIGLGASGIKAYVFSAMLNELNHVADKYSSRLGLRVKFSVDLTKASKPFTTKCYKGEYEITYEELSGGEKQRIDIVMALALHDVIAKNSNINLLIFDEAFENLDEEGRSIVLDLIKQKAEDKTVFVVSHADIIEALGVKYISVEKDEKGSYFE